MSKSFDDVLYAAYYAGYVDADNGKDEDFETWREEFVYGKPEPVVGLPLPAEWEDGDVVKNNRTGARVTRGTDRWTHLGDRAAHEAVRRGTHRVVHLAPRPTPWAIYSPQWLKSALREEQRHTPGGMSGR